MAGNNMKHMVQQEKWKECVLGVGEPILNHLNGNKLKTFYSKIKATEKKKKKKEDRMF